MFGKLFFFFCMSFVYVFFFLKIKYTRLLGQPTAEVPNDILWSLYEEEQTQIAIQASQQDSFRYLRAQQDKEYAEALRQQAELDKKSVIPAKVLKDGWTEHIAAREKDIDKTKLRDSAGKNHLNEMTAQYQSGLYSSASPRDEIPQNISDTNASASKSAPLQLDPLPLEPSNSKTAINVRVRLPNGVRCARLFANCNKLNDVKCWINHELVNNDLSGIVNRFRLMSTHPRTIYNEDKKTLEELGFWRANTTRQLETPILYVEESLEQ
ncbi:hypothetical protein RFI_00092 [Reticulomyxa filosa]|uniref:UBX domain-containing protein n=1 Tax=Reticulomyxa filosa TaxID=46433 RepID=X6PFI9_RETFI|nr:hypothetical protein RFI_00092 [Reticulomyxa filosa]|eukprot:ETO36971.1 hypothetical protein RFI_00092 [Reticulomyxa filosa]